MNTKSSILKCMVVDDESIAIRGLTHYINKLDYLELISTCSAPQEAYSTLNHTDIDLLFLDINMPTLTGIELLESLKKPPLTIFTTAYSEYALDAFNLHVVDYLLKPIGFERFSLACQKAYKLHNHDTSINLDQASENMYIRQGDAFIKIKSEEILFVEAMQNYLKLFLKDKVLTIHQTMASMEDVLSKNNFIRTHRSYLVNANAINSITGNKLKISKYDIPISRQRKEELMQNIVYKNLISK